VKLVVLAFEVKNTYKFGPRKVAKIGRRAAIYLPKELQFLQGKIVQVTIEVLNVIRGGDVGEDG